MITVAFFDLSAHAPACYVCNPHSQAELIAASGIEGAFATVCVILLWWNERSNGISLVQWRVSSVVLSFRIIDGDMVGLSKMRCGKVRPYFYRIISIVLSFLLDFPSRQPP